MRRIVLIAHNLRSAHNVGSLLRTADGLAVESVWLTGYTPYPVLANDSRLPHISRGVEKKIAKVSLGAEKSLDIQQTDDVFSVISSHRNKGYIVAALEQTADSQSINTYNPPAKICLVVGREVEGIEESVLKICDMSLEIPMYGQKESYNVSVATAMALYRLRFAK
jgi:23S rRNA (guanosine2251-2'-O)-methyltransferase